MSILDAVLRRLADAGNEILYRLWPQRRPKCRACGGDGFIKFGPGPNPSGFPCGRCHGVGLEL